MTSLREIVAAHPLEGPPYNAIKFVRIDGYGTLLYRVGKSKEQGALKALKQAFELYGGHCFYCKTWMKAQKMSQACTRDHVRPTSGGGQDYLHNLVLACGACNRSKGGQGVISFRSEAAEKYVEALDQHIVRCLTILDAQLK